MLACGDLKALNTGILMCGWVVCNDSALIFQRFSWLCSDQIKTWVCCRSSSLRNALDMPHFVFQTAYPRILCLHMRLPPVITALRREGGISRCFSRSLQDDSQHGAVIIIVVIKLGITVVVVTLS